MGFRKDPRSAAQMFENLVGRTVETVWTLSSGGTAIDSKRSNESLIPAQNQRWRRA
jgi:hypothetical protein